MDSGKGRATSRTVGARLPNDDADLVEAAASAAGLTPSEYLASAIRRQRLDQRPALAALAAIMRVAAQQREGGIMDQAARDLFARLVGELADAVRAEIRR